MAVVSIDHVQLAMPGEGEDAAADVVVVDDEPLEGYDRVYVDDPFGNRIDLMQPLEVSGS